jgi:hypothetical protein
VALSKEICLASSIIRFAKSRKDPGLGSGLSGEFVDSSDSIRAHRAMAACQFSLRVRMSSF